MLSLPTDVRALLHPPQFTSSRWRNVPHEGRLRSVGCKGSRPRCAAMYILRITGCLLLRCLSCCSRVMGSCGGICPHTDPPPCRREAYETRVPPACGRTQERLCAYSYSNSIIVCWPWFVSNSPTHPSYLVESVVEYPLRLRSASRCTNGVCLFILYQYFRFVHIMSSAPPGYAQGYAVGRHYHAVLRGRIVAEDDGTEGLVHSSTITNLWLLLIDVLHRLAPNTPTWWLPKWVSIHSP